MLIIYCLFSTYFVFLILPLLFVLNAYTSLLFPFFKKMNCLCFFLTDCSSIMPNNIKLQHFKKKCSENNLRERGKPKLESLNPSAKELSKNIHLKHGPIFFQHGTMIYQVKKVEEQKIRP